VFLVLLSPTTVFLLRVLIFQLAIRKTNIATVKNDYLNIKIAITAAFTIFSLLLIIYTILVFGFPSFKMPYLIKISGGIFLIFYWFMFSCFIFALGAIIGYSGYSTLQLFKMIFGKKLSNST